MKENIRTFVQGWKSQKEKVGTWGKNKGKQGKIRDKEGGMELVKKLEKTVAYPR